MGLNGVSMYTPNPHYAPTVPHMLFMVFQMTFAVITPALVSGAVVERMKFSSYFVFLILWSLFVYCPMAHMIWGYHGILGMSGRVKALDFAGGTTVETRPEELRPHNLPYTMVGTALLWIGWFGFNAGSAQNAGPLAVSAFVATQLAGATAALTWLLIEWFLYKKPSVLGFASGAIAGMVAITPAAGFLRPCPAILVGLVAAFVSFYAIKVKNRLGYDDSLDVFAVHGCAGAWGMIATGLFATLAVNSAGANGLFNHDPAQLGRQAIAAAVAIIVAGGGTFIVARVTAWITGGLRSSALEEENGLDVTEHGESGYSAEEGGVPASVLGN
jgi:ammonium transporter, Amt family